MTSPKRPILLMAQYLLFSFVFVRPNASPWPGLTFLFRPDPNLHSNNCRENKQADELKAIRLPDSLSRPTGCRTRRKPDQDLTYPLRSASLCPPPVVSEKALLVQGMPPHSRAAGVYSFLRRSRQSGCVDTGSFLGPASKEPKHAPQGLGSFTYPYREV